MASTLFNELKHVGINEELAHSIDKALDPQHVATRQDLLLMNETILKSQLQMDRHYDELNNQLMQLNTKIDRNYTELNSKIDKGYTELNSKVDKVSSDLRVEIATISRQFWITFSGLITTMLFVFGVNWYFH